MKERDEGEPLCSFRGASDPREGLTIKTCLITGDRVSFEFEHVGLVPGLVVRGVADCDTGVHLRHLELAANEIKTQTLRDLPLGRLVAQLGQTLWDAEARGWRTRWNRSPV